MKEHELKDETALQTYFIEQAIADVTAKGKKVIGWDEILEPGLDTSAIIMNWRGVKAAITAAQNGHEVIMSPGKPLYFDYYQSKQKDSLAIGGFTPWDSVYLFEPIPVQISAQGLSNRVLGVQANVWTEYMAYPSKVEYMIFPRMTALSEVLWTDKNKKDITDFKRRLEQTAVPRYQFWNSSYYKNFENIPGQ
jgi:hexosaminidase